MFINFNIRTYRSWVSRNINSFIYKGGVNVIVIPKALNTYCILVKYFGFSSDYYLVKYFGFKNTVAAFLEWRDKYFKDEK